MRTLTTLLERSTPHARGLITTLAVLALGSSAASQTLIFSRTSTVDMELGFASAAGDFDGDGKDDLAFSAPGHNNGKGRVYLQLGNGQNGLVAVPALATRFGHSIESGDLDGDGKDDLVIGAPESSTAGMTRNGAAYVFRNFTGQFPWGQSARALGFSNNDEFGTAIAILPDVASTGTLDFVVGSPAEFIPASGGMQPASGAIRSYIGTGTAILPVEETAFCPTLPFGSPLRYSNWGQYLVAGNFDGNTTSGDVVIGYSQLNTAGGTGVTTVLGMVRGGTAFTSDLGEINGFSADNAGDLDGDGVDEVISVRGNSAFAQNRVSLRNLVTQTTITLVTSQDTGQLARIFTIEDFDGNGYRDFLYAGETETEVLAGDQWCGEIFVPCDPTIVGTPLSGRLTSIGPPRGAASGDFNHDGFPDWAIGYISSNVSGLFIFTLP